MRLKSSEFQEEAEWHKKLDAKRKRVLWDADYVDRVKKDVCDVNQRVRDGRFDPSDVIGGDLKRREKACMFCSYQHCCSYSNRWQKRGFS